jgi:F0F1-type ATP synthase beta subunit
MSGFFDGVNKQSVSEASDGFREFKIGDNHAQITQVKEKISKESGNLMLEITFADEEGATIQYYIVDGEYKLSRLKQLYKAFKIPIGETNIQRWIGRWGMVVCKAGEPYNGKVYNKVHFVKPDTDDQSKPTNSYHADQKREQKPAESAPPRNDGFEDDIPF